jgi:hypothetical protein
MSRHRNALAAIAALAALAPFGRSAARTALAALAFALTTSQAAPPERASERAPERTYTPAAAPATTPAPAPAPAHAHAHAASTPAALPLRYDPAVVTLQGTLRSGDGMTPDGQKLKFPALRLSAPIAVAQDAPRDWPAEQGVVLLHLALDEKNMAAFKRLKGKPVQVTGTLFHADNGNQQTKVLIFPESIVPAP